MGHEVIGRVGEAIRLDRKAIHLHPLSGHKVGIAEILRHQLGDTAGACLNVSQRIRYPGSNIPVPFNRIPAAQLSPISVKFMRLWPTSQAAGGNPGTNELSFSNPFDDVIRRINSRIDHQLSPSNQMSAVFHRQWGRKVSYPGNLVGPEGEQIQRADDYAFSGGWNRNLGSALLNNFRLGYMHRIGHRTNAGQGFTSGADFGIQGIPP